MSDIEVVQWIDEELAAMERERRLVEDAPTMWLDLKAAIDHAVAYFASRQHELLIETNGNQQYLRTVRVKHAERDNATWKRAALIEFDRSQLSIRASYSFPEESDCPANKLLNIAIASNKKAGFRYEDCEVSTVDAARLLLWPVLFGNRPEPT